jgi:multidrug resistance efflux pump
MNTPFADGRMPAWMAEADALQACDGPPAEFWPRFLACAAAACGAGLAVALRRRGPDEEWRIMFEWSQPGRGAAGLAAFRNALPALAARALGAGACTEDLTAGRALAARVPLETGAGDCVVATFADAATDGTHADPGWLKLLSPLPAHYLRRAENRRLREDATRLEQVLETLAATGSAEKFLPAALALCNEVAAKLAASRVCLGWLVAGQVRVQAVSRTSQFERRSQVVQRIEAAMEECADQDEEILWPVPPAAACVARAHAALADEARAAALLSLPLRVGDAVVAVLTLERPEAAFTEAEVIQVRLLLDQATLRLAALHDRQRGWWRRAAGGWRGTLAKLLGPERTWTKALALAGALLLLFGVFWRLPYRIEGTFILRGEHTRAITAPFTGYLEEVLVRPGDTVAEGQVLLRFATDELLLQLAEVTAEASRHEREAERARAADNLAAMRVSEALAAQARARLAIVRHRLELAELRSTLAGVVVEGDLRGRIGTLLQQSDPLLRVARLDGLYIEAEIPERDVHYVAGRAGAEISFLTRPDLVFPAKVASLAPAALPKDQGNVFLLRAIPSGEVPDWWRPGMSGVVKIDSGPQAPLWIVSRRTVDFLRLWLWW